MPRSSRWAARTPAAAWSRSSTRTHTSPRSNGSSPSALPCGRGGRASCHGDLHGAPFSRSVQPSATWRVAAARRHCNPRGVSRHGCLDILLVVSRRRSATSCIGGIVWEMGDDDGRPEGFARWTPADPPGEGVLRLRRDCLHRFAADFDFDVAILGWSVVAARRAACARRVRMRSVAGRRVARGCPTQWRARLGPGPYEFAELTRKTFCVTIHRCPRRSETSHVPPACPSRRSPTPTAETGRSRSGLGAGWSRLRAGSGTAHRMWPRPWSRAARRRSA